MSRAGSALVLAAAVLALSAVTPVALAQQDPPPPGRSSTGARPTESSRPGGSSSAKPPNSTDSSESGTPSSTESSSSSTPAPPPRQCANPNGVYPGGVSWGQRLVDPQRIWPLTNGVGQVVAVIGTGVDGANAQFRTDQVREVQDLSPGIKTPEADCDGRGTIAAGIIAAQPNPKTTFTGIAPGAQILPIRYTQSQASSTQGGDPGALAAAIRVATEAEAGVILIAVPAASDSPGLNEAVAEAISRGSVVVSAAEGSQQGESTYPTATDGVLAVGSVNAAGEPVQAEAGGYLGMSAPGADLVSTSAGAGGGLGHRWPVTDPGLAAAYVAGTAALVRAYHPKLNPRQVINRLTLTANRPPTGGHDQKRGWGVLDAYAAVSAQIPADAKGPGERGGSGSKGSIVPAVAEQRPPADRLAGVLTLSGVALAAAAGVTVAAVRRGRARGWRPGRFRLR